MSEVKYTKGKPINSLGEFEKCESKFFKVRFGKKERTIHRSFLINWPVRQLTKFIYCGWISQADLLPKYQKNVDPKGRVKING